jgi:4-diphosphocytidyl-2-C-methyl-D-erythritol kinase
MVNEKRSMSGVQSFVKKTVQLESHAKVNLMLRVLRRRTDGYHDIKTIFQKISLHDTLRFALKRTGGVSISTDDLSLPTGEGNLVHRAALLVLNRSGYKGGIAVRIRKRIPIAAGLGGGSSNAATTLKALNQLLRLNLPSKKLMSMGLRRGRCSVLSYERFCPWLWGRGTTSRDSAAQALVCAHPPEF